LAEALLQVRDLRKEFALHSSAGLRLGRFWDGGALEREPAILAALDGVSFDVHQGEAVGVVGESGCGKSTLAKCLVKLVEPTTGTIRYDSRDVRKVEHAELKRFREQVQIVFQDPAASLDPRWKVRQIVAEPLRIHGLAGRGDLHGQLIELLDLVGLRADHLDRLPSELSGGEQQRVSIARALATRPRLLVLDEPTSALDASTRVHVLDLLASLRRRLSITYVLISHDLTVIRALCDRVLVMYLGRVVEVGPTEALFDLPLHPYTEALLAAIPVPDPDVQKQPVRLRGDLTRAPAVGCALAPRCPMAAPACRERPQKLVAWGERRLVACHRISEGEIQPVPVIHRLSGSKPTWHEAAIDSYAGILPRDTQTIADTDA
jgi:oligopeptide/dipeptide ABC transporter ATP-binding protein